MNYATLVVLAAVHQLSPEEQSHLSCRDLLEAVNAVTIDTSQSDTLKLLKERVEKNRLAASENAVKHHQRGYEVAIRAFGLN